MDTSRQTERAEQVRRLFDELIDLEPEARVARLRQLHRQDADVAREVAALLEGDAEAGAVLDRYEHVLRSYREAVAGEDAGSSSLSAGQSVSHYRVLERLGAGGMGVVYKALDLKLDRTVALKCLPARLGLHDEAKQRFVQEARAAAQLDHPNICPIYEIDETADGLLFIAMAYVEGETLKQKIARGPLAIAEALDVAIQMGVGLSRAHAHGIVHRDVKPANVIVAPDGTVRLVDFGVARIAGDGLTRTGQTVGTVAYMAPEQVRAEEVDQRTDLWALGVVLYEMLTGRRPFRGDYDQAVLSAILHETPEPVEALRPDIPEALAQVVSKALQKSPEARYAHADALVADLRAARAARPAIGALAARVPAPLTGIVGREEEIKQILALLAEVRLLTLTGPAGTGKTRLATEVATRLGGRFRDGVFFVPLDALTEPDLVAPAVAHALGVVETAARPVLETLKEALRHRRLLLILDNFEQVAAAAPDVAELLAGCPELKVLVTSRMPLRLTGEQEYPVPPLALPPEGEEVRNEDLASSPAVRLFVERARAAQPQFTLSNDNAAAVASLCACLDGLPLAIELAAARIKLFSPQAIMARLNRRLDLLKGDRHDRPARHQTLRQAIDWSYDLLDEAQRRFFRHASVFAGGFTLEAAEAVCCADGGTDVLDAIEALIEQSLIRREDGADGEPRFRMLETLRAYGLERLQQEGEVDAARTAHQRFFTELAEEAAAELSGTDAVFWLDRLDAEHNNLRAALAWAVESGNAKDGLRLGAALSNFWSIRGYLHEGRQRLEQVLRMPADEAAATHRAKALNGLGMLTYLVGDFHTAETHLEESLTLWRRIGHPEGIADTLNDLSWVALELSDAEKARRLAEEALALCRRHDDRRGIAIALYNLGWLESYRGHYWNARDVLEESIALHRSVANGRGEALARMCLAWAETIHGRYDQAIRHQEAARDILQAVNDPLFSAFTLFVRSLIELDQGAYGPAAELLERSIDGWRTVGHRPGLGWALCTQAEIERTQGRLEEATACVREGGALFEVLDCSWGISLVHLTLGRIAHSRGDVAEAETHFRTSLAYRIEWGLPLGAAECLETLAAVHDEQGRQAIATRLLAAAGAERERLGAPLPPLACALPSSSSRPHYARRWDRMRSPPPGRKVPPSHSKKRRPWRSVVTRPGSRATSLPAEPKSRETGRGYRSSNGRAARHSRVVLDGVEAHRPAFVCELFLQMHPDLFRYPAGGSVGRSDGRDDTAYTEPAEGVFDTRPRGLGRQAPPPVRGE